MSFLADIVKTHDTVEKGLGIAASSKPSQEAVAVRVNLVELVKHTCKLVALIVCLILSIAIWVLSFATVLLTRIVRFCWRQAQQVWARKRAKPEIEII